MQWMQRRLPISWACTLYAIVIGTFKQRVPQVETDFTRASIGSPISSKVPIANWNVILSTFSCYINIIKKISYTPVPPWMSNNIKRGNTKCKLRVLLDLQWRVERLSKDCRCARKLLGGGEWRNGRKHIRTATQDYCLVQLIIIIIIILAL